MHDQLLRVVLENGYERRDEPVQLRSGEMSEHFVDGKRALRRGADLAMACRHLLDVVTAQGITFDAVGGLTMGADHFSHGVAIVGETEWFSVRKERKGRGTNKLIEGTALGPGTRVLLVDDVVSTGGSIQQAYRGIVENGADVVAAVTMVDRGDVASAFFEAEGIPYFPLLTYRDLDIPPIGARSQPVAAST